jgi:hypothetical protein
MYEYSSEKARFAMMWLYSHDSSRMNIRAKYKGKMIGRFDTREEASQALKKNSH